MNDPKLGCRQPAAGVNAGTPSAALRAGPIAGRGLWHGTRRCACLALAGPQAAAAVAASLRKA
ncbi:hypothetical protein CBM2587_B100002 [Cupriavidus taiwanensis]|uniref:Uncharacterized protein n=1 Tax=Cupriavidus taiwanensis TaxID=164546 RepID=A0A375C0H6_9BURK|nr:hypothetical protein CBM2587_B100002 [Cupriavidus taiwanensis]